MRHAQCCTVNHLAGAISLLELQRTSQVYELPSQCFAIERSIDAVLHGVKGGDEDRLVACRVGEPETRSVGAAMAGLSAHLLLLLLRSSSSHT